MQYIRKYVAKVIILLNLRRNLIIKKKNILHANMTVGYKCNIFSTQQVANAGLFK